MIYCKETEAANICKPTLSLLPELEKLQNKYKVTLIEVNDCWCSGE